MPLKGNGTTLFFPFIVRRTTLALLCRFTRSRWRWSLSYNPVKRTFSQDSPQALKMKRTVDIQSLIEIDRYRSEYRFLSVNFQSLRAHEKKSVHKGGGQRTSLTSAAPVRGQEVRMACSVHRGVQNIWSGGATGKASLVDLVRGRALSTEVESS